MRRTTTFALSTVSFGALALAAAAPASAQVEAATAQPAPEAIECEALPTQPERDACVAKETTTAPATTAASADTGTIVVTGSRIRRDEFTAAEPLAVITAEEITQAGFNSVWDAVRVKRLWGEVMTPFGMLRVGRQPQEGAHTQRA